MPIDLRFSIPAAVIAMACSLVVVVRAATVSEPPARPKATPAAKIEIAAKVAETEAEWFRTTTEHFPSDDWSQRDDFGGLEFRRDEDLSQKMNTRIEDVLRAVDDDIHAKPAKQASAPDARAARAVPCKPRPFYD